MVTGVQTCALPIWEKTLAVSVFRFRFVKPFHTDDRVAHGAVLDAGAGVEQTQVVVDLGDGAHRRAEVIPAALLAAAFHDAPARRLS